MAFGYLTLFTALIISLSAAVYSILGLTAIFAAAFWPIVIMGGSLEFGKIITTLWLHKYWDRAEIQYKLYLCSAVAILMLLTSMGVFGFLSKAHSDQSLVSGDVTSKISIYDEKIKIARDNIDANRKALTQMDAAVDQVMGRSTSEQGADKAVSIRRSQGTERSRLLKEIDAEQKKITALNDEAAPIRAEVRKVDAEVGPIKYIAALIYGDNPDANILEKSVRWVIILIVIVFDPLALTLLLAATKSLEWEHGFDIFNPKKKDEEDEEPKYEADDGELTPEQWEQLNKVLAENAVTKKYVDDQDMGQWNDFFNGKKSFQEVDEGITLPTELEPDPLPPKEAKDPAEPGWMFTAKPTGDVTSPSHFPAIEPVYTDTGISDTTPVHHPVLPVEPVDPLSAMAKAIVEAGHPVEHIDALPLSDSERKRIREQYAVHTVALATPPADNVPPVLGTVTGFGTEFPANATRGDLFLRVDQLPTVLYKYNGTGWIEVDKSLTDSYAYDSAYIEHLIEKISNGAYDPDLLSDAEREQIALKLKDQI